jgi:hypothetical protein
MPSMSELRDAYVNNKEVCVVTMYHKFFGHVVRYDNDIVDLDGQPGGKFVQIPVDMIENFASR